MTDRPAHLDDLLEHISGALAAADPLPPHNSIALDVLTDALVEGEAPSPASAFAAAKYVLAQHARELADLIDNTPRGPAVIAGRLSASMQLHEYATRLDGQTPAP